MLDKTWFEQTLEKHKKSPLFLSHGVQLDFLEAVLARMKQLKVNKTELARRLGCVRSNISKMFACKQNLSLMTVAKIALVLNMTYKIELLPLEETKNDNDD